MQTESKVISYPQPETEDLLGGDVNAQTAGVDSEPSKSPDPPRGAARRRTPTPLPTKLSLAVLGLLVFVGALWTVSKFVFTLNPEAPTVPVWQTADQSLQTHWHEQLVDTVAQLRTEFGHAMQSSEDRTAQALDERVLALTGKIGRQVGDLSALRESFGGIEREVAVIKDQLDHQDATLAELRAQLEALPANAPADVLQTVHDAVAKRLRAYDRKWTDLAMDAQHSAKGVTDTVNRNVTALPFRVSAIDIWNGEPQVAVKYEDQFAFLRVGDQWLGWTVVAASYGRGYASFVGPGERSATVTLRAKAASTPSRAESKTRATLTVITEPADARVRVLNIKPRYQPGMAVTSGAYEILVQKRGFQRFRRWVWVGQEDRVLRVQLEPKAAAARRL